MFDGVFLFCDGLFFFVFVVDDVGSYGGGKGLEDYLVLGREFFWEGGEV